MLAMIRCLSYNLASTFVKIADKAELLDRIDTRHLSLTQKARSAMAKAEAAAASSPSSSASHPYPLPLSAGSPIPTSHLSSREELALKKVMGEFEKVQALQDEKVELAERMERIVLRAKERGRAEWIRVGGKDIAEVESEEMEG
jgi:chromatin modification-related protein YNG2